VTVLGRLVQKQERGSIIGETVHKRVEKKYKITKYTK